MKTTVIVTLTFCCLFYQTIRAATISRDGLSSAQIREILDMYNDELSRQSNMEGIKRSGCTSFGGCMRVWVEQASVANLLHSKNAHMFGPSGVGKRRRSVDNPADDINAE